MAASRHARTLLSEKPLMPPRNLTEPTNERVIPMKSVGCAELGAPQELEQLFWTTATSRGINAETEVSLAAAAQQVESKVVALVWPEDARSINNGYCLLEFGLC